MTDSIKLSTADYADLIGTPRRTVQQWCNDYFVHGRDLPNHPEHKPSRCGRRDFRIAVPRSEFESMKAEPAR